MQPTKYLTLSRKILQNKLAMKGIGSSSLFRLDLCVTWKCNSRCTYCKIWETYAKNPQDLKKELVKEDYEKLFNQLKISWLHVTGGEPFLKKDLPEIIAYAAKKTKPLLIDTSTNGFLVDHTVNSVRKVMKMINCNFVVGVSLDGPSDIHIKSRGIKDGWNKTVSTFLKLREMKKEFPKLDVHINHFLSPMNLQHFDRFISELAEKDVGIDEISIEVARYSPFFMNEKVEGSEITNKELLLGTLKNIDKMYANSRNKSLRVRMRRRYIQEAINFWSGNKKTIPCSSGYSEIFIDPYGFVWPCSQLKIPIGNIKKTKIRSIVESDEMKKWREKYHNCQICWSGCEGMTSMVQNIPFSLFNIKS